MSGRRMVAIFLASSVLGGAGVFVLNTVLGITERNRQAIRVNCVLLSNAIKQSGAGGATNPDNPQRKLNVLYVGAIKRLLTVRERKRETELLAAIGRAGPLLTLPDCDAIAQHPEGVTAQP